MYRKEHPKPQFCRETWQNLNGEWEFQIDNADSGRERGLFEATASFDRVITVPFCPHRRNRFHAGCVVSAALYAWR